MTATAFKSVHGALTVVVAASTAIRLWTISERSFWFDEAFSYTLARDSSWTDMLQRTASDVHPPLYYAALCFWSHVVGTSVVGLRMFSVFCAAATLMGCYLFCRDALPDGPSRTPDGRWIGVSAAALIGACSLHIKWSQEARMYTMGTALVFFSTWLLVRALRADARRGWWWCGYTLSAVAFAYTHNFALFSIAGQALYGIGVMAADRVKRARLFQAILVFLAVAVAYLPWVWVLVGQTRQAEVKYWTPPFRPWTIPGCLAGLVVPANSNEIDRATAVLSTVAFAILLAFLAWKARSAAWLLLAMIVTPFVCATVVSLTSVPVFISRYFLFSHMFVLCAIPLVAVRLLSVPFRTFLLAFLATNSLIGHATYWLSLDTGNRPGIGAAVKYATELRNPGEEVVVTHPTIYFSARYYLRHIAQPRLFLPKGAQPHYMGGSAIPTEWRIDEDVLHTSPARRIWVLDIPSAPDGSQPPPLPDEWMPVAKTQRSFRDVYDFLGTVSATAYERRLPATISASR